MKNYLHSSFFIIAIVLFGCGQKSGEHDHGDAVSESIEEGGNQALETEVNKIHDDAMAKMEKLYNRKGKLKDTLVNTPGLSDEKKKEIEAAIATLDSANKGMTDWMHEFQPFPDSLYGEERAREYLENEMEKIKKVRENMLEALQKSKLK